MHRVLLLMAAAGVLVWAGALLDLGGAHDRPRRASSSAAEGSTAPSERAGAPARAPAAVKEPGAASPQSGRAPGARAVAVPAVQPPPPGQGDVRVIGSRPAAAPIAPGTATPGTAARVEQTAAVDPEHNTERGELGEGVVSPEYVEVEESYVNEARDGAWATAQEQRVHAVLSGSAVGPQVALVHCQETVCRIVLQTDTADAFQQLLQVPGLTAATGVGPSTPYSLRGGQLSVYFKAPHEDGAAARK